ncbi:ROK family transcriptional regulator [Alicyclobacillus curvatus]|nr:ROK family transcriptional regulator [Alicyclobacillus curvatus]
MRATGDQTYIKNLNRSIVLNLLRFHSPLSRVEISRQTGLTKATVSGIIEQLIQEQYVLEDGLLQSTGVGRKPVPLRFNPGAGHVIGVDVGVDYFRVLVMDLSCRVLNTYEDAIADTESADETYHKMVDIIKIAVHAASHSPLGVIGVGVGIPGLVDSTRGVILNAPNLHWKDIPLRSMLEGELGLPIFIENEANVGAIGEQLFGAGRDVSNVVFLSLGRGIGTGIILNDHLIRGQAGIAGEFGHMTIDENGPECSCGNRGCLELYASETAVIRHYKKLTNLSVSFKNIIKRLEEGDENAKKAVESAAHYLGVGLASLVNALNPALILVSSRFASAEQEVISTVAEVISGRSFIAPYSPARVQTSQFGSSSCGIGAGALALQAHFSGPESSPLVVSAWSKS